MMPAYSMIGIRNLDLLIASVVESIESSAFPP